MKNVAAAPTESHSTTLIGSVQRAMRLLEAVAGREHGAPAKQLARDAGLALPTAYHLLRTLTHEGYLRRDKGLFFLGDAAERLSSSSTTQKRRITMSEALAHWQDTIGVPVRLAVYCEGEIDVMSVADATGRPTVDDWGQLREAGHAHAIGQCLLFQLREELRCGHPERDPAQSAAPCTVCDGHRPAPGPNGTGRTGPAAERQGQAGGTVCAAIPITVGTTAGTMAISMPVQQADRLLSAVRQLQAEVGRLLGPLDLSISI